MIGEGILLLIGVMMVVAGVYYRAKDKDDAESRKIYGIIALIGAALTVAMAVKMFVL